MPFGSCGTGFRVSSADADGDDMQDIENRSDRIVGSKVGGGASPRPISASDEKKSALHERAIPALQ